MTTDESSPRPLQYSHSKNNSIGTSPIREPSAPKRHLSFRKRESEVYNKVKNEAGESSPSALKRHFSFRKRESEVYEKVKDEDRENSPSLTTTSLSPKSSLRSSGQLQYTHSKNNSIGKSPMRPPLAPTRFSFRKQRSEVYLEHDEVQDSCFRMFRNKLLDFKRSTVKYGKKVFSSARTQSSRDRLRIRSFLGRARTLSLVQAGGPDSRQ